MTDTLFEDRLRRALNEIADAVPELPERPIAEGARGAESGTRRRAALAAAALLVVVGLATALVMIDRQGGDGGVSVVADDDTRPDGRGRSLVSLTIESTTVHLEASGPRCVDLRLVDPGAAPGVMAGVDHDPACLGDGTLAIQAASVQGKTVVYGLTDRRGELSTSFEETKGSRHVVALDRGVAFVFVIDDIAASGVISLGDADGVLGQATFDRGGPARLPKEPVGSARILLPFVREGAVWAALDDGREVRLTDGTERFADGGPLLAPDGHTVLYSDGLASSQSNYGITYSVNARTGETRRVDALGATAFSPDGRFLATSVPKDDTVPEAIRILDTRTYDDVREMIAFGGGGETYDPEEIEATGMILSLAWDKDGERLLAITQAASSARFWSVDPEDGSIAELQALGVPSGVRWSTPDHAIAAGRFPTLALGADAVTWGELRVEEGTVRFDDIAALPERASRTDGSEVPLDLGSPTFAFIRQLQTPIAVDDRGTIVASGDEPVYLLTNPNGRLFLLSQSGRVQPLDR